LIAHAHLNLGSGPRESRGQYPLALSWRGGGSRQQPRAPIKEWRNFEVVVRSFPCNHAIAVKSDSVSTLNDGTTLMAVRASELADRLAPLLGQVQNIQNIRNRAACFICFACCGPVR
jgi:hypothetical protein